MGNSNAKKELMIICRSQPIDFEREVIYIGQPISLKDIPSSLKLDKAEARKYYLGVSWIEIKEGKMNISNGVYNYNELLAGERSYGIYCYSQIDLPLNDKIKEGLVKLLSSS